MKRYKEGDKIGLMTLVRLHEKVSYGANKWVVLCDCGKESVKSASDFWKLQACSYTCPLHKTRAVYPKNTKKERHAWLDIKSRCFDPNHASYHLYGGRGITMCGEWADNFVAFYRHIGPAPSRKHSVDRIDNDKGYEPGNVRWATQKVQSNNRTNTVLITANGKTQPLAVWAEELGQAHSKLYWRYTHGWSHEDIINK